MNIHIYNATISNEEYVKLLGVNFEDRLNFGFHVSTLLNNAKKKYHVLSKACNRRDTKKRRVLMNKKTKQISQLMAF